MRILIFTVAMASSLFASTLAGAWTAEQPSQQSTNGVNLADPDEQFKALQDKVNAKTQLNSGFTVTGGVNNTDTPYSGQSSGFSTAPTPFGYSPMPGFRR